jgi:hypothetical protein
MDTTSRFKRAMQFQFLIEKLKYPSHSHTGVIGIWRCTCRDWPFSSASKPIDLGLGFQVHRVYMLLNFPASTLVGTFDV